MSRNIDAIIPRDPQGVGCQGCLIGRLGIFSNRTYRSLHPYLKIKEHLYTLPKIYVPHNFPHEDQHEYISLQFCRAMSRLNHPTGAWSLIDTVQENASTIMRTQLLRETGNVATFLSQVFSSFYFRPHFVWVVQILCDRSGSKNRGASPWRIFILFWSPFLVWVAWLVLIGPEQNKNRGMLALFVGVSFSCVIGWHSCNAITLTIHRHYFNCFLYFKLQSMLLRKNIVTFCHLPFTTQFRSKRICISPPAFFLGGKFFPVTNR